MLDSVVSERNIVMTNVEDGLQPTEISQTDCDPIDPHLIIH